MKFLENLDLIYKNPEKKRLVWEVEEPFRGLQLSNHLSNVSEIREISTKLFILGV